MIARIILAISNWVGCSLVLQNASASVQRFEHTLDEQLLTVSSLANSKSLFFIVVISGAMLVDCDRIQDGSPASSPFKKFTFIFNVSSLVWFPPTVHTA